MFGNIIGGIAKIFGGSAQEKALKEVMPIVDAVNAFYSEYQNLNNDELRNKTVELKQRIQDFLTDIDTEIHEKNQSILALTNEQVDTRSELFVIACVIELTRDIKLVFVSDTILLILTLIY